MIGWLMRGIVLGIKLEDCAVCHQICAHVIIRKTHWFSVVGFPVVFLGFQHRMICTTCRAETPLSFVQVRRAMRSGRLPLERGRPEYQAAVREYLGAAPEDWQAFGVPMGASIDVLRARYRDLAKESHPDRGGSDAAFSEMAARYQRLIAASETARLGAPVDAPNLFDPLIVNPHRGFFDFYLKAWPVVATMALVAFLMSPQATASGGASQTTGPGTNPTAATAAAPLFAPAGHTASEKHLCWYVGSQLTGCLASGGGLLFGEQTGTPIYCYFTEPHPAGAAYDCYRNQ